MLTLASSSLVVSSCAEEQEGSRSKNKCSQLGAWTLVDIKIRRLVMLEILEDL